VTTENSLEIEVKIKLLDSQVNYIRKQLLDSGFTIYLNKTFEHNTIYDTLKQNLKQKRLLLRLRKIDNQTILTFKRPALNQTVSTQYKVREELEIEVSDFNTAQTIINGLGYEVFFIYEKYREILSNNADTNPIMIMLDETPIGHFMEIEAQASQIDNIASQLGFSKEDYNTSNYLSLFREHHKTGHMQFKGSTPKY
jgi:adenylate cyclase, class 2